MKQIIILIYSGLKANIRSFVSLLLLCTISAMLINTGLTTIRFGESFSDKVSETNSPDVVIAMAESDYTNELTNYVEKHDNVEEYEEEDILYIHSGSFKIAEIDYTSTIIIRNINNVGKIAYYPDYNYDSDRDDIIYVSKLLESTGGYKIGDDIDISILGKEYTYEIAGFLEDPYFGSVNLAGIGFVMNEKSFENFSDRLNGLAKGKMIKIISDNVDNAQKVISDCQKNVINTDRYWSCYYGLALTARTTTGSIISVIIFAFSLLISAVLIIVLRFKIKSNIANDITNIGIMKVIGFKNRQIKMSYWCQYMLSIMTGCLLGIVLSFLLTPAISAILSMQSGLTWMPKTPIFSGVSVIIVMGLIVSSVIMINLQKMNKYTAVESITQNFSSKKKRKTVSFEKTNLGKYIVLSLNYALSNIRTNIGIFIIIIFLAFASSFSAVLYYNININTSSFINLISNELCDIQAVVPPDRDSDEYLKKFREESDVRKAEFYDIISVSVNDESAFAYVSSDFSKVENNYVYEGSFPDNKDEVSIGGGMADRFNLKIGDKIKISFNGTESSYTISGIQQTANNVGMDMSLTYDGALKMKDDYKQSSIYIYCENDSDIDSVFDELSEKYKDDEIVFSNIEANIKTTSSTYIMVVTALAAIMLITTALIIVIVLNLVIGNTIIEQTYNLVIQKAIGYTTGQLMLLVTMIYFPVIIIGSIIGGTIGFLGINPILALLMRQLGIMKAEFAVTIGIIGCIIAVISVWGFVVSFLASRKIKNISINAIASE